MGRMKHVIVAMGVVLLVSCLEGSVGKIVALKGNVEVLRNGAVTPGAVGTELEEKDRVNVKGDGKAQLLFNDETVVTIGKDSTFIVEGYRFGGADDTVDFSVPKGVFRTITGQIAKAAPEKFRLVSRTATIGVRGTHFLGRIDPEWDTIACTVGEIAVSPLGMDAEVHVPAGQITFVAPQALPTPPRDFRPDEIRALTKAVGNGGSAQPSSEQTSSSAADGEKEEKTTQKLNTAEVIELMESDQLEGKKVILVSGPGGGYFQVVDSGADVRSVEQIIADEINQQLQDTIAASQERTEGYTGRSLFSLAEGTLNAPSGIPSGWDMPGSIDGVGYAGIGDSGDYGVSVEKVYNTDTGVYDYRETHIHELILEGQSASSPVNLKNSLFLTGLDPITAGGYTGYSTSDNPYTIVDDPQSGYQWIGNEYALYDNMGEFIVHANVGTEIIDGYDPRTYIDAKYYGTVSEYSALPTSGITVYTNVFQVYNVYETSTTADYMENAFAYMPSRDALGFLTTETAVNFANKNGLVSNDVNHMCPESMRFSILRLEESGGDAVLTGKTYEYRDDLGSGETNNRLNGETTEGSLYGTDYQGVGFAMSGDFGTGDAYHIDAITAGYKNDSGTFVTDTSDDALPTTGYAIGMDTSGGVVKASVELTVNATSGDIDATFSDSVSGTTFLFDGTNAAQTSAYVANDAFGVLLSDIGTLSGETLHQGMMVTLPVENADGTHNEYTSWGYWGADFTDDQEARTTLLARSVWIAGEPTVSVPTSGVFSYSGSVIGSVQTFNGGTLSSSEAIAMNGNNVVSLSLDFGSPSSSFIQSGSKIEFDTVSGQQWRTTLSGGTLTGGNFSATSVLGTGNSAVISSANVNGTLYGPDAAAVGGSFDFGTADQVATGVFQAKKQ